MASKIKKTIMFLCCTILVLFVALSAVFKVNFFQVIFLPTYITNDELEYYNGFLPQSKISCPYSISNYQEKELDMWYFKDLTGKIKENIIGKDFWVYNDNFDILFCSDGKKYIRNDTHFSSDITSDMVNSISFFEEYPVDVYKEDIAIRYADNLPNGLVMYLYDKYKVDKRFSRSDAIGKTNGIKNEEIRFSDTINGYVSVKYEGYNKDMNDLYGKEVYVLIHNENSILCLDITVKGKDFKNMDKDYIAQKCVEYMQANENG